jgi:hypothetical protein
MLARPANCLLCRPGRVRAVQVELVIDPFARRMTSSDTRRLLDDESSNNLGGSRPVLIT